jgi:lysophospholipid acyltransferase (LPLAT)-like uncharacterized protein
MQTGPVQLARASGAPVYLMGLAVRPAFRLGSWDGGQAPLPFARGVLWLEGPLSLAADADAAAVQAARAAWETKLNAAQARAEALLGA